MIDRIRDGFYRHSQVLVEVYARLCIAWFLVRRGAFRKTATILTTDVCVWLRCFAEHRDLCRAVRKVSGGHIPGGLCLN